MRSRSLFALAATLLAALCLWAEPKIRTFADRDWAIELPAGYEFEKAANPNNESMTIAFFPKARPDKTRPIMQVTLFNAADGGRSPKFSQAFAEAMIAGVQKGKTNWKVETSTTRLGELTLTRYAWSGGAVGKVGGATANVASRGVMLVGSDRGLGFALHVQDVAKYADQTLPAGEKALRSFRLD